MHCTARHVTAVDVLLAGVYQIIAAIIMSHLCLQLLLDMEAAQHTAQHHSEIRLLIISAIEAVLVTMLELEWEALEVAELRGAMCIVMHWMLNLQSQLIAHHHL